MAISGGAAGTGFSENLREGEGVQNLAVNLRNMVFLPSDTVFVGLPWLGLLQGERNCSLLETPWDCGVSPEGRQTWYRIMALPWCDLGQVLNLLEPQCCRL